MDQGQADFATLDGLNEQLAAVVNYLATTPNTPFTASRRHKMQEEMGQLVGLIQQKEMMTQEGEQQQGSHNSSSPSQSLSPAPSPLPPFLTSNSASVSGFSTPDLWSTSREHYPFASVSEEPLNIFPDDDRDRLAQELAYLPHTPHKRLRSHLIHLLETLSLLSDLLNKWLTTRK